MTPPLRIALYALPFLALTALIAWFALALAPGRDPSAVPSALIDKPAPQIDLPSIYPDRAGLNSADLKGRASVVNVFASWCVPCRAEHPSLAELAQEHGVPVIGLNWKDKPEDARAFLNELGDPYERIGSDPSGRAGIDWGVYGVPETFVVDKQGVIRFKQIGPVTAEALEKKILPLVRELQRS